MSRTLAVMQPTFLPWLGYFGLIAQADVFVLLDTVEFSRGSWHQRNRIRTASGLQWVTLPVAAPHMHADLQEARLADEPRLLGKLCRMIEQAYARMPGMAGPGQRLLAEIADLAPGQSLAAANGRLIRAMAAELGIATPILNASELPERVGRVERLLGLCAATDCGRYLSPMGAAGYLMPERQQFAAAGLDLRFQAYEHPVYAQKYAPFLPYASALDALIAAPEQAGALCRSGIRPPLAPDALAADRLAPAEAELHPEAAEAAFR